MGNMIVSGTDKILLKEGRKTEKYLIQTQRLLNADAGASYLLGKPIIAGKVVSQTSCATTVDGKKMILVEAIFEVNGSNQNGMAHLMADEDGFFSLQLKSASGRMYDIHDGLEGRGRWAL
jgi:hypothetical protein